MHERQAVLFIFIAIAYGCGGGEGGIHRVGVVVHKRAVDEGHRSVVERRDRGDDGPIPVGGIFRLDGVAGEKAVSAEDSPAILVEHCGLAAQAEGQGGVVEEVIFETAADESEVALAEFNVSVGLVGGAEFGMQAGAGVANDPVGDGAAETGELDARGDIIGGVDIVFKAAVGGGQGHIAGLVPEGAHFIACAVYCIGMALFTMIMGNGFAAFSVITVGVGIPFLINQGANPAVVGALGLTAGYCGTLLTPMAANFNIMPAALLETKGKYSIIKAQAPIAVIMMIVHILLMYFWAF